MDLTSEQKDFIINTEKPEYRTYKQTFFDSVQRKLGEKKIKMYILQLIMMIMLSFFNGNLGRVFLTGAIFVTSVMLGKIDLSGNIMIAVAPSISVISRIAVISNMYIQTITIKDKEKVILDVVTSLIMLMTLLL